MDDTWEDFGMVCKEERHNWIGKSRFFSSIPEEMAGSYLQIVGAYTWQVGCGLITEADGELCRYKKG